MNKIAILISSILLIISVIILVGCTESDNSNGKIVHTEFFGSWVGNLNYSRNMDFSFPEFLQNNSYNISNRGNFSVSSNITKLKFSEEIVYITITTNNGSMEMPNSYILEGDQLILSPLFSGERPEGMQPPNDLERPSDWNRSSDWEQPPEWEEPPDDWQRPSDMKRPSRTNSYAYSFNEDYTILYLNNSPFTKTS